MNEKSKTILFIYLLGAIVVLAFVMRFPFLNLSPLGDDEGFTVFFSARSFTPWNEFLWGAVKKNGFPPLDFILNHFVYNVFGITQATVRFLPTFFDTLTVLILGLLGFSCCNRKTGLIAALLWALSPCTIYYAKEARYYAHFAFAVSLYLLSISYYIRRHSIKRLIFILFSIVYGFNVSILFTFVMIPVPLSLLVYYILKLIENKHSKFRDLLFGFFYLVFIHIVGALVVFTFYKWLNIFAKTDYYELEYREMYTFLQLLGRLIIRINQAIYVPSAAIGVTNESKGFALLLILFIAFLISLTNWRKYIFIKTLIFSFLAYIPIYDLITLYFGNKFAYWTQIRHIYFIVPVIYLGLAFSYNVIFSLLTKLLNFIYNKNLALNYLIASFFVLLLILSFDTYALSDVRKSSQTNIKSNLNYFYKWLDKKSSDGEVLIVVRSQRAIDCSLFSYISLFEYNNASNIYYRIPLTVYSEDDIYKHKNDLVHQIYSFDETTILKIIKNDLSLGIICYDFDNDIIFDNCIFDKKTFDIRKLNVLKPISNRISYDQFLSYSNFFGNIFVNEWKGRIRKITSKLINKNTNFANNLDGWKFWKTKNYESEITVTNNDDNISCVQIKAAPGKFYGVTQTLNLEKGKVYKLSGKAKTLGDNKTFFGGQILLSNQTSKNGKSITFPNKSSDWLYKELIFTNDFSGNHSLIISVGYFSDFKDIGCFTDVKLEELLFEDQ